MNGKKEYLPKEALLTLDFNKDKENN